MFLFLLAILPTCFLPAAASPSVDSLQRAPDPVVRVSADILRIGTVELNTATREIRIPATVNMQRGLVEVFAAGTEGKLHESVLACDVVPHYIHVALLLLGLKDGNEMGAQGDSLGPRGDMVDVFVEWKSGTTTIRRRAEELVFDGVRKTSMRKTAWAFRGSRVVDGTFMADVGQSLITTYNDADAILDNPLQEGKDDTVYFANESVVPPPKTPVILILKPVDKK